MQEAILNYAIKAKNNPNYCSLTDFESMHPYIKRQCENGEYFTRRNTLTDFKIFENIFGYKLPKDIGDLINLYWHPYIYGFYKLSECIVLFSCHKHKTENDADIMKQKDGIIDLGINWRDVYAGDISQYLPIGWKGYSGSYILYELSTGRIFEEDFDNDGKPAEEPFANSLKELIQGLSFEPTRAI